MKPGVITKTGEVLQRHSTRRRFVEYPEKEKGEGARTESPAEGDQGDQWRVWASGDVEEEIRGK
jgi:hypothetical protein